MKSWIKTIFLITFCIALPYITGPLFSRPMVHSFTAGSGAIVQAEYKMFPFSFSRIRYYIEEESVETVWLYTQADQITYWRKDADGKRMERFVYPDIGMTYFMPLT